MLIFYRYFKVIDIYSRVLAEEQCNKKIAREFHTKYFERCIWPLAETHCKVPETHSLQRGHKTYYLISSSAIQNISLKVTYRSEIFYEQRFMGREVK